MKLLFSIIASLFILSGCSTTNQKTTPESDAASRLQNTSRLIETNTNDALGKARQTQASILTAREKISGFVVEPFQEELRLSALGDLYFASSYIKTLEELLEYNLELNNRILRDAVHVQNLYQAYSQLLMTGQEAKKNIYNILAVMFGFGSLIIVGGVVLAFWNPRLGIMVAGIGIVTTAIAAAGTFYLQWIALVGFAIIALGFIILIYYAIKALRQGKIFQQTAKINTQLLEITKQDLPEDKKKQIFGDGLKPGVADIKQPPKVKQTIAKIRRDIKKP